MTAPPVLTLHHPSDAALWYERGLWKRDTFASLVSAHAAQSPDAPALRDSGRRLTWAELAEAIHAAQDDLAASALPRGTRVSFLIPNRLEAVVYAFAAIRLGYIVNPSLHRDLSAIEVAELVGMLDSGLLILERGHGAAREHDFEARLSGLRRHPGVIELAPGRRALPGAPSRAGTATDDPDHVCYIAFTSGTTGRPKGVMHSQNTLLANARDLADAWDLGPTDVIMPLGPTSHHIFWVAVAQSLVSGAELVLNDVEHRRQTLDWLLACGATYVLGVPTHAVDLLAEQQSRGMTGLGSVRIFYMAGAQIPPSLASALVAQGITPQNVYGMSENSSHNFTQPDDDLATIIGTCGKAGPSYEIRIVSSEDPDLPVAQGDVGQIAGRGACLMLGYFGDQLATERSFNADRWFLSGDLGRLDLNGNLEVVGRLKDLIIRGGHNIYPAQIERLAVEHPSVQSAVAVGMPDDRLGEVVCLGVVPLPGHAVTADEMLAFLHDRGLARSSMPEYFFAVEAFPATATGKILKRGLLQMIREGRLAPSPCRFVDA